MRDSIAHPDVMPILSPGRHRSPRRGACFMEFASYLAGERWSDHPACTQGTLAHLARMVNDLTSEAGRAQLTPLIPTVVGLTSDDPLLDVLLAVRAASAALPIAAEERQRSQAVGCASPLGSSRNATTSSPRVARTRGGRPPRRPRRRCLGHPVHRESRSGPRGHDRAAVPEIWCRRRRWDRAGLCRDPDERLVALLTAAVSDTARFVRATREAADVRAEAGIPITV